MVQMSPTVFRANTLLEEKTNQHLQKGAHLELTFAPPKTELLYCLPLTSRDKNKSIASYPPRQIGNHTIMPIRQIKYLSMFIDESVSFIHHATMATTKENKTLTSLGFLHHQLPGIPTHIAHHLAMMVILPTMFCVSPAWWSDTPIIMATLNTTDNSITRWITGLPLNTRTSNLITLVQLPPLRAYLDYLSLRYAIRLCFLPSHHTLGPLRAAKNMPPNFPGLHCLYNLSKHLVIGKLKD